MGAIRGGKKLTSTFCIFPYWMGSCQIEQLHSRWAHGIAGGLLEGNAKLRRLGRGTYTKHRRTFELGVDRDDRGEEDEDGLELHFEGWVDMNSESLRNWVLGTEDWGILRNWELELSVGVWWYLCALWVQWANIYRYWATIYRYWATIYRYWATRSGLEYSCGVVRVLYS
jgi:hypothetical protein